MQLEVVFMCPSHYQPRVIFRPPPRELWQCLETLTAWGSRPQWTTKHLPCLGQPPYQRFVVFLAHKSCLSLCNTMQRLVAHQATLSMRFPRQEYWSGLPFPSLGDLPNPGILLMCPALAGRFFTTEPPGKPSLSQNVNSA